MLELVVNNRHEDPVDRLNRFRIAHPDVDVMTPEDNRSHWWKAYRDGQCLAVELHLEILLDDLDWLLEDDQA